MVFPALLFVLSIAGASCTMAARAPGTAAGADRTSRISASQFGSDVSVRVGDVLVVERPAEYDEWNVDFSGDVVRSLNTEEGRRKPPPDGWTFAVIARGTTDLAFTPHLSRGGTPNVPRFVITVTAK